jgi:hypothetical protein
MAVSETVRTIQAAANPVPSNMSQTAKFRLSGSSNLHTHKSAGILATGPDFSKAPEKSPLNEINDLAVGARKGKLFNALPARARKGNETNSLPIAARKSWLFNALRGGRRSNSVGAGKDILFNGLGGEKLGGELLPRKAAGRHNLARNYLAQHSCATENCARIFRAR